MKVVPLLLLCSDEQGLRSEVGYLRRHEYGLTRPTLSASLGRHTPQCWKPVRGLDTATDHTDVMHYNILQFMLIPQACDISQIQGKQTHNLASLSFCVPFDIKMWTNVPWVNITSDVWMCVCLWSVYCKVTVTCSLCPAHLDQPSLSTFLRSRCCGPVGSLLILRYGCSCGGGDGWGWIQIFQSLFFKMLSLWQPTCSMLRSNSNTKISLP